jgi:adenine C2-methylase RlmN of 23S rRNA A2503 and tRNA A37
MSADLTLEAVALYARTTQSEVRQEIVMKGIKSEAEGAAALASILMEQAAQIAAIAYDQKGRAIPGSQPNLDTRV